MTLLELRSALIQEYPKGILFTPTALRLLQGKWPEATVERLDSLKAEMFHLSDDVWLFTEQVMDAETLRDFPKLVNTWLHEAGYLTLHALRMKFEGRLRVLHTATEYEAFFDYFFQDPAWRLLRESGIRALQHSNAELLRTLLERDASRVSSMVEDAGGALRCSDALAELPHLDGESLAVIMKMFAPDVHEVDLYGEPGWQKLDTVHLPDDFSGKLTRIMELLLELGFKATLDNLNFALSMAYEVGFRKEYALEDEALFRRVVEKYYQGTDKIYWRFGSQFAKAKEDSEKRSIPRPEKTERKQGEIVGTDGRPLKEKTWKQDYSAWKDPRCIEIVEIHAEGVNITEIAKRFGLAERTIRNFLNVHAKIPKILALNGLTEEDLDIQHTGANENGKRFQQPTQTERVQGEIIGLDGKPLKAQTWRNFCWYWKDPRRGKMAKMQAEGKSFIEITKLFNLSKNHIDNFLWIHHSMPKLLEINGLTEEDLGV